MAARSQSTRGHPTTGRQAEAASPARSTSLPSTGFFGRLFSRASKPAIATTQTTTPDTTVWSWLLVPLVACSDGVRVASRLTGIMPSDAEDGGANNTRMFYRSLEVSPAGSPVVKLVSNAATQHFKLGHDAVPPSTLVPAACRSSYAVGMRSAMCGKPVILSVRSGGRATTLSFTPVRHRGVRGVALGVSESLSAGSSTGSSAGSSAGSPESSPASSLVGSPASSSASSSASLPAGALTNNTLVSCV